MSVTHNNFKLIFICCILYRIHTEEGEGEREEDEEPGEWAKMVRSGNFIGQVLTANLGASCDYHSSLH